MEQIKNVSDLEITKLQRGERIRPNYWRINNYWRIRWCVTLAVAIFATITGLLWSIADTKLQINYFDIIVAAIVSVLIAVCWGYNKTLDKNRISQQREKNIFHRFLYYVIYFAPSILSGFVIGYYMLISCLSKFWASISIIKLDTEFAIVWAFVLAVDLGFVLYRWTYRVLPNVFFSVAAFIFYILLTAVVSDDTPIVNYALADTDFVDFMRTDNLTKWLSWGIFGTIISTVASKGAEDFWHGFSRSGTGDYAKIDYRFKQQRMKLLSYVGGNGKTIKNLNRMDLTSVVFLAVGIIEGSLLLILKRGDSRHLLGLVFLVGVTFAMLGRILYRFITDENLMRSENSYLLDRKIQAIECLKKDMSPCSKLDWEWSCYCQVFVNLFCSRNPIFYENNVLHEAGPVISYFLELEKDQVCFSRVLADFVDLHKEQFLLYCGKEAGPEKDYMEAQFANIVVFYLNSFGGEEGVHPIDFSKDTMSLRVLHKIFKMYFTINGEFKSDSLNTLVGVKNVSAADEVNLIKLDFIRLLTNEKTESNCKLCRWCKKQLQGDYEDVCRAQIAERRRSEFPQIVQRLMLERWGRDNLVPCNWQGKEMTLDEAFKKMEDNYNSNWLDEACHYGIEDREYWKTGIFFQMEEN